MMVDTEFFYGVYFSAVDDVLFVKIIQLINQSIKTFIPHIDNSVGLYIYLHSYSKIIAVRGKLMCDMNEQRII